MYIDKDLLEKVKRITGYKYNEKPSSEDDLVWVREINVLGIIEDLVEDYNHLEEIYKDFQQNVEENYEQIPYWKQVL